MERFGFLNINKPEGITSHTVISKLRKKLNIKRIGHSGTLDPFASGVLPVAVSNATRLIRFLPETKAYEAVIDLRFTTDTDDLTGEELERINSEDLQLEDLKAKLALMKGSFKQIPPLYSAIKVNGKKLYERMRRGEPLDLADIKEREVYVSEIQVLDYQYPFLHLNIYCKAGLYIRSIARDLGGHLKKLLRIESNSLSIQDSVDLDDINLENVQKHFINPGELLVSPALKVADKQIVDLQQGKFLFLNAQDFKHNLVKPPNDTFNFREGLIQCIGEGDEFAGMVAVHKKKTGEFLIKPKIIV